MHEVSIVQQIVGTLDNELSDLEKRTVTNIIIHVGEISNVQPILLNNAFEAFQQAELKYTQSKLTVIQIPVEIYCKHCNKNSKVQKYIFKCTECDRPSADVVHGEELLIHKIEFDSTENKI